MLILHNTFTKNNNRTISSMRCDVLLLTFVQFVGNSYLHYAQAIVRMDNFTQSSGKQFSKVCEVYEGLSAIGCASACQLRVIPYRCVGANYNRQTGECGLTNDHSHIIINPDDGNMALQRVVCTDDQYLVSGPNGVPDEFLTVSSHYNDDPNIHLPKFARLTNMKTDWAKTAWAARTNDQYQWIEARFRNPKTVKRVAIQGRINHNQWVTEFRVSYSTDCIDFQDVSFCNGTSMNFAGNTDATTIVTQTLPAPVTALCVRLNPRQWIEWITMRFDITGC